MGRDFDVLDKSGVAPNADGVVREATCAGNLLVVCAPAKAGNLRSGVDAVRPSTGSAVPEVDVTIV